MSRYYEVWNGQTISPQCHERLLDIGRRPEAGRRTAPIAWRRWGALAACCALVLGLGLWRAGTPSGALPGGESSSGGGTSPAGSEAPTQPENGQGSGFLVEGGLEDGTDSLPAIPYVNYQSVDGQPAIDGTPSRLMLAGSYRVDLTWEEIQKIFWGSEGKPEGAEGELPWMLFWGGFTLSGYALYDGEGALMWVALSGDGAQQGTSFTLVLRPGELPFQCGLYSDLETTEVFGTEVTGWRRTDDTDGDGAEELQCVSELMAEDVGVRFSVICAAGEDALDTATWYSSLLVRQVLSQDGGVYLDHLRTNGNIPAWREAEFSSLEEARQEEAFAPYLPEQNIPGYGEFYGSLSYQEGVRNTLSLWWHRGYDSVEVRVSLPEGELSYALADPDRLEEYDLRLYSIPWSESVPEEYRDTVDMPTFRSQDMSLAIVETRGHEKDTGGLNFSFGVLHENGVLVEYRCDGLTAQQVWALVQETLPENDA